MRRGAKPEKAKVEARRPVVRKSPKNEASKRHDLEKRLGDQVDELAVELIERAEESVARLIASSRNATSIDSIVRSALTPSFTPRQPMSSARGALYCLGAVVNSL